MNPLTINPWVLIALGVAWAASLVGVGVWQRSDGKAVVQAEWATREAKINAESATKIHAAEEKTRAAEHQMAVNLVVVATEYQAKLKEKDNALAAARTAARTGGLWVNAACPPVAGNAAIGAAAGAGFDNGSARVRLSAETADALIALASDADRNTDQLRACQQVVEADRAPP